MPEARLVAAASVALSVTLVAIFSLRPLAPRLGLVDRPDERKCHRGRVPLIGGLCFFLGILAGLSYLRDLDGFVVTVLAAGALVMLTGLLDDLYDLSVRTRLAMQIATATVIIAVSGVYVDSLGTVGDTEIRLYALGIPVTVIAVVGLVNAFNMMDGIDGLAGGLALVAILAFLGFAMGTGWQALGVLMLLQLMLAAMIPYLGVNLGWPDGRKIFMGDAGSTVVGFLLAWCAIYLSQRDVRGMAPIDTLWCVAIPVMDTLGVMVRRIRAGRSPFKADRLHLHHLLLDAGCSQRKTLVLIVASGGLLAGAGYALRGLPELVSGLAFAIMLVVYMRWLPAALQWLARCRPPPAVATEAVAAAFAGEPVIAGHDASRGSLRPVGAASGGGAPLRALCVLGESHDAVRIAPVARQMCHDSRFDTHVCVTDLDSEKQRRILELFELKPNIDLHVAAADADPSDVTSATLDGLKRVLQELRPDVVLVHGDTSATLAATLAACYQEIPVARLESAAAAMRLPTASIGEQINHRVASALASLHFTPSESTGQELVEAGIPRERIRITGDTAIETLRTAVEHLRNDTGLEQAMQRKFPFLREGSPLVLVTHREDIAGFAQLGRALRKVARKRPDVDIVYPIAMSHAAQRDTQRLGWRPANVHLVEPLDYLAFAWLLQRAYLVLTGSGEVQGEAALLRKPILVLRDAGEHATARDLPADDAAIAEGVMTLLSDPVAYESIREAYASARESEELPSFLIVDVLAAVTPRSSALAA